VAMSITFCISDGLISKSLIKSSTVGIFFKR
jgi:hypothetical protein